MNEEKFNNRKRALIQQGIKSLYENSLSDKEIEFVLGLLFILYSYTYDNRLEKKGLLGYVIRDKGLLKTLVFVIELFEFDEGIQ